MPLRFVFLICWFLVRCGFLAGREDDGIGEWTVILCCECPMPCTVWEIEILFQGFGNPSDDEDDDDECVRKHTHPFLLSFSKIPNNTNNTKYNSSCRTY